MISGICGHVDNSRRLLLTNQQCKSNKVVTIDEIVYWSPYLLFINMRP